MKIFILYACVYTDEDLDIVCECENCMQSCMSKELYIKQERRPAARAPLYICMYI